MAGGSGPGAPGIPTLTVVGDDLTASTDFHVSSASQDFALAPVDCTGVAPEVHLPSLTSPQLGDTTKQDLSI